MINRCETCGWWERFVPNSELGVCKRNAPENVTMQDPDRPVPTRVAWPETFQADWCGEHTAVQRRRDRLMLAGQITAGAMMQAAALRIEISGAMADMGIAVADAILERADA